jgi:hypothetical protein
MLRRYGYTSPSPDFPRRLGLLCRHLPETLASSVQDESTAMKPAIAGVLKVGRRVRDL